MHLGERVVLHLKGLQMKGLQDRAEKGLLQLECSNLGRVGQYRDQGTLIDNKYDSSRIYI